jgi:hypothetical protein
MKFPTLPQPQHTKGRIRLARCIALSADAIQLAIAPLFLLGSVFNIVLDVAVCITMTYLLGFRLWFLPSFFIEGLPIIDLAPTWSIAVFLATRNGPDAPPVIESYEKSS